MVSAGTNEGRQSPHSALVTLSLKVAQRKAQSGDARRLPQTLALRCQQRPDGRLWTLRSAETEDPRHPSPAPSAFGMLQNPATSTPFSVNAILRLEREQIGLEALQLQGARRSPESPHYLPLVPEPRESEVPNTSSCDGGDRRQDGSETPGDANELVTEMDAERVGEYTLKS